VVENAPSSLVDEALSAIELDDDSFFECYLDGDYCDSQDD
jgi:hypothetical protein